IWPILLHFCYIFSATPNAWVFSLVKTTTPGISRPPAVCDAASRPCPLLGCRQRDWATLTCGVSSTHHPGTTLLLQEDRHVATRLGVVGRQLQDVPQCLFGGCPVAALLQEHMTEHHTRPQSLGLLGNRLLQELACGGELAPRQVAAGPEHRRLDALTPS